MAALSRDPIRDPTLCFSDEEFCFARNWELYAPGLGGWTVIRDLEDDGAELVLVYPPLSYEEGFTIHRETGTVVITWCGGVVRVGTLREALLRICPLSPEHLRSADAMAALPAL